MSMMLVMGVYGASAVLALVILFFSGAKAWYWHVLSVAVALGIGLMPVPVKYNNPTTSLIIGSVFTFLLLWGVAAPFLGRRRR
jgi:hypothetical protein